MRIPDFNDFVVDINGFIGTPDTVLPMTAKYYLKHGYKEPKLNAKLIEKKSVPGMFFPEFLL